MFCARSGGSALAESFLNDARSDLMGPIIFVELFCAQA
jgi:hypothetical protein